MKKTHTHYWQNTAKRPRRSSKSAAHRVGNR